MATYSITEAMSRVRGLPRRAGYRAAEIMKEEIQKSTHGIGEPMHLADTIKIEERANDTVAVTTNKFTKGPYGIREVGAIITDGRKALELRDDHHFKALHWEDPIGVDHFAHSVGPAKKANPFLKETAKKIRAEIAAKGLSL